MTTNLDENKTGAPVMNQTFVNGIILTANRAVQTDENGVPEAADATATELGFIEGLASSVQTQLNGKEPTLTKGNLSATSPLNQSGGTGAIIGSGVALTIDVASSSQPGALSASDWTTFNSKQAALSFPITVAQGGTASAAALSNNRIIKSSSGTIVEASAITASMALISDANGIPTHSAVSSATLAFLDASSSVQTQINGKEPTITTLSIAKGGTASAVALNNNRVMVSSSSAIAEAAAITASKMLKSNENGIPVASTLTEAQLSSILTASPRNFFRPDMGNWNAWNVADAFPMFQPAPTDLAVTITKVRMKVRGVGTTPTLKFWFEIRAANATESAGTRVWTVDKQLAASATLTDVTSFDNASIPAGSGLYFCTPTTGALVSGTSITYFFAIVELA